MSNPRIRNLQRLIKLLVLLSVLAAIVVMLDFSSSDSLQDATQTVRIPLPPLPTDRPGFFRFDNKQIVIVRYSSRLQQQLFANDGASLSVRPEYYVAFAYGTHMGCPLKAVDSYFFQESCSTARYDFAGRPLDNNQNFTALRVPVYTFCPDFSCINLRL